ncbi:MAG TPA: response regulator transcription factor [Candidatus Dormibacteraeota bacterium]|jgi:DNA-binding response OmpR family regulator|nr:response regulator transcription factor [Candidatus Dormibacteraeota bacterium]
MSQRIIAFDPSPEYRSVVSCLLDDSDGYQVSICDTYPQMLDILSEGLADLIIVSFADLPDPEHSLATLREKVDTPILAFVQSGEETKAALRCGADYDLPKPFDPEVFTVAVEAVLRRGATGPTAASLLPPSDPIAVQDLKIYPDRRTVERHGRRKQLSQTEWQLFAFMLRQPGRTFTRRELAAGAWGPGYASRNGQAELYVSRVRRKVERDPQHPRIIETVRGAGYRLVLDEDSGRVGDGGGKHPDDDALSGAVENAS